MCLVNVVLRQKLEFNPPNQNQDHHGALVAMKRILTFYSSYPLDTYTVVSRYELFYDEPRRRSRQTPFCILPPDRHADVRQC